jgi:hypothetical protein
MHTSSYLACSRSPKVHLSASLRMLLISIVGTSLLHVISEHVPLRESGSVACMFYSGTSNPPWTTGGFSERLHRMGRSTGKRGNESGLHK